MRSLFEKKPLVLLLAILALGALTILSVSLRDVSFSDPQPIGREEAAASETAPQAMIQPLPEVSLQSKITLWISMVILLALVAVLLSPEARKRMIRILFRLVFTYLALYFLFKRYPDILSVFNLFGALGNPTAEQEIAVDDIPPPVFTPPQETPLLSYFVSLLIVLGILYLAWRLYRTWKEFNVASKHNPLQEIARIARSSLRDLSDGRESTDVILNCYFRMSDVVADKRNLQRGLGMTPSEFAIRLEQSGLPGDAVRRLTKLFEAVRYGERKAGPKDVNEAVACLTTILQYCGEPV